MGMEGVAAAARPKKANNKQTAIAFIVIVVVM
jgi:hypothetical protein